MKNIFLSVLFFANMLSAQTDSLKINDLEEVILVAKNPIAQQFSVQKIGKMDIYFNPAADGDPLKAITTLPASTNVEETANPTLRGGTADRSRVYLNGSPILNPVRFSRNDGLGSFSLFNTELLKNQWVYVSNPPLSLGNSSAGAVEMETNTEISQEFTQIALSVSNLGLMRNQKLSEKSFVQLYGNYQFDKIFIPVNYNSLENLKSFSTFDLGANTHLQITENLHFNSFNYFIDENYRAISQQLNFSGEVKGGKKRFFSVNNLDFLAGKTKIRWASSVDFSDSDLSLGGLFSNLRYFLIFNGLSVKHWIARGLSVQYGMDTALNEYHYNEKLPRFYFSLKPDSQFFTHQKTMDFFYVEPYFYARYEPNKKWGVSSAIRKNIFLHKDAKNFVSYQFSANYKPNSQHRFLLSGGTYHSYATPNYFVRSFNLLSSNQIALDYFYETEWADFSLAIFYKQDKGEMQSSEYEVFNKMRTLGNEISAKIKLNDNFSLHLSNMFLDQKNYIDNQSFNSKLNLKYFIKSQLIYTTPTYFTASVGFTMRPGNHFTPVKISTFHSLSNDYEPKFGDWYSATLPNYSRVDFSANKVFFLNKNQLIAFVSISNLLNTNNIQSVYYNEDYSKALPIYFQKRIFYGGIMWKF